MNFLLHEGQAYTIWGKLFCPENPWSEIRPGLKPEEMASPLYYTSLAVFQYTVKNLLEKGANVNAEGRIYDNTLLAASIKGHKKIVQQLLDKGANVNAEGRIYGNTLLDTYIKSCPLTNSCSTLIRRWVGQML